MYIYGKQVVAHPSCVLIYGQSLSGRTVHFRQPQKLWKLFEKEMSKSKMLSVSCAFVWLCGTATWTLFFLLLLILRLLLFFSFLFFCFLLMKTIYVGASGHYWTQLLNGKRTGQVKFLAPGWGGFSGGRSVVHNRNWPGKESGMGVILTHCSCKLHTHAIRYSTHATKSLMLPKKMRPKYRTIEMKQEKKKSKKRQQQ